MKGDSKIRSLNWDIVVNELPDLAEKQPKISLYRDMVNEFFQVQSIKLISLRNLIPELYVFYLIAMGK